MSSSFGKIEDWEGEQVIWGLVDSGKMFEFFF